MEILDFFEPVDIEKLAKSWKFEEASWYHAIEVYNGEQPDLSNKKIALIGITEPGEKVSASYEVRKYLYSLKRAEYAEEIIDLGDFHLSYKQKSYESLGFVLSELIAANLHPIILNGRQEITYAQYLAFTYLKQYSNLVVFDGHIDFNLREDEPVRSDNYLQKLFIHEPAYLFGCATVGYQSYFTDTSILDFLEKMYFDLYRLGDVRANLNDLEPVLRSGHFASWDMSAIRQSDSPGTLNPSPNGFYGEEACLLCRYAGMSNSMRSIGFYNYVPAQDRAGQTAQLCAQMIWYFIEGCLNRYPENPLENKEEFLKFITNMQNNAYQIVFYKSQRTDRWWMEVPLNDREYAGSTHLIPCSYNDYLTATREEIPDRWMHAVRKFS